MIYRNINENVNKMDISENKNLVDIYKKKLIFDLSTIGYAFRCKISFTNRFPYFSQNINSLEQNDSVFISPGESNVDYNELLNILKNKNIKVNFYIIDEPTVDIRLVILLLPYTEHMFLQNNIYSHPNIHNLPIGIRDCEKVVSMHKGFSHDYLYDEGLKNVNKEFLCLLCFSFSDDDRYTCYNTLKDKSFVLNINDNKYETQPSIYCGKVPVWINYEFTHKSYYILSPKGYGQATHRFFEAIYLDSTPIVKKTNTPFDKLYDIFPCLVVDNWDEVTETLLIDNKEKCLNKLKKFKYNYLNAFTDLDSIHSLLLLT